MPEAPDLSMWYQRTKWTITIVIFCKKKRSVWFISHPFVWIIITSGNLSLYFLAVYFLHFLGQSHIFVRNQLQLQLLKSKNNPPQTVFYRSSQVFDSTPLEKVSVWSVWQSEPYYSCDVVINPLVFKGDESRSLFHKQKGVHVQVKQESW